jgi:hypothetical protein
MLYEAKGHWRLSVIARGWRQLYVYRVADRLESVNRGMFNEYGCLSRWQNAA